MGAQEEIRDSIEPSNKVSHDSSMLDGSKEVIAFRDTQDMIHHQLSQSQVTTEGNVNNAEDSYENNNLANHV